MTKELEARLEALEKALAESRARQQPSKKRLRKAKLTKKRITLIFCAAVVVLAAIISFILYQHTQATYNPVPASIRKSVPFPVYFPDNKKLPPGFTLNTSSFSHNDDAVIYTVSHGTDMITFSVQAPASTVVLSDFNTKQIPLHTTLTTPYGNATKGAISQRSVVSLPIDTSAWIIVTGPDTLTDHDATILLSSLRY